MQGWDKALVSYTFFSHGTGVVTAPLPKVWRGRRAPKPPETAPKLNGALVEQSFQSEALGEERKLSVYTPGGGSAKGLPVLFVADGPAVEAYAKVYEPLLAKGKVRRIAMVGIHHGGYRGDLKEGYNRMKDRRMTEYVPGLDSGVYERHMKFFTQEVQDFVVREYGFSGRREDHAVFGASNGGAIAAAAALRRPDLYGAAMPFAVSRPPADTKPGAGPLPKFHFQAGTLESFLIPTQATQTLVRGFGADTSLNLYVGGHDVVVWELAFSEILPRIFPPAPR
jgi:enterochelin esterase-like enzyme